MKNIISLEKEIIMSKYEKRLPYYKAFYGANLPDREFLEGKLANLFWIMMKKFKNDLVDTHKNLRGNTELLKKALIVGLEGMQLAGAKHPNAYEKAPDIQKQALTFAKSVVSSYNNRNHTQRYIQKMKGGSDEQSGVSEEILTLIDKIKSDLHKRCEADILRAETEVVERKLGYEKERERILENSS